MAVAAVSMKYFDQKVIFLSQHKCLLLCFALRYSALLCVALLCFALLCFTRQYARASLETMAEWVLLSGLEVKTCRGFGYMGRQDTLCMFVFSVHVLRALSTRELYRELSCYVVAMVATVPLKSPFTTLNGR